MFGVLTSHIPQLEAMKKYPQTLYYKGSLELLQRPKISIVGTRNPSVYTKVYTHELAKKLALNGMVVVSGAAAGVDTVAHEGASIDNTIAVLPCGIDIRYPAANKKLIEGIERNGLTLSQFENDFTAREWSFVVRNEVVVALGDVLIITEAALDSGSMRSAEFAIEMGKSIYVLPHHLRESEGTHWLCARGYASAIEDIDTFVAHISKTALNTQKDTPFIAFCRTLPTYEEVMARFAGDIFQAELLGIVEVKNGRVVVV